MQGCPQLDQSEAYEFDNVFVWDMDHDYIVKLGMTHVWYKISFYDYWLNLLWWLQMLMKLYIKRHKKQKHPLGFYLSVFSNKSEQKEFQGNENSIQLLVNNAIQW